MPGLDVLEKFRQEITNLGKEKQITEDWGEQFVEYESPKDFLNSEPQINIDELLATIEPLDETTSQTDAFSDDPVVPEELLDIVGDAFSDEPVVPEELLDAEDLFDIDDLPSLEEEEVVTESAEAALDTLDDFLTNLSFEESSSDLESDDAILDLTPESLESLPEDDASFDLPGLDNADPVLGDFDNSFFVDNSESKNSAFEVAPTNLFTEDSSSELSSSDEDFSNFVIPEDLLTDEVEDDSSADIDGFEGFSFDENIFKESVEDGLPGSDEFSVPDFSDFVSGSKASLSELPAAVAARKAAKKEIPMEISEKDFQKFLYELSLLPLNLRIAIQEFIAESSGSDLQKMEIVHQVLTDHPIKKIVYALEKYLDRSIQIPKDFVKKSHEDYEREKASLKYFLINKVIPLATVISIISILIACVSFLSYQFIYRPLAAESRYKRGFIAIQDERYTQSLELFDEAIKIWEKKRWYFTFAQEYRAKKQYISAETIYLRLLNRYKNDKEAGLEYAGMLREDLRNFEKAETIVKRRLLDFHVNDSDALLLLGDIYLDWAEEDFSKYEEAKKIYTQLIELYGQNDSYLVRMLRYHIRVDALADVLTLKQHFMNKKAKIGASDLTELSGYLLDKRYEPKPGDSEYLITQIEDVRTLLERAVEADLHSPDAHYNMGRFLLYNYNTNLGTKALQEAISLFKDVQSMSIKRAQSYVDSYRLLGEVFAEEKEFLKAQSMYLDGMSLYSDLTDKKAIKPSVKIGKLFSNYADIDYFISNDLDTAFDFYQKAIKESYDTASIRYRLGYIFYKRKDYDEAMKSFNYVLAQEPNDKNLLFGYANTMFKKDNYYLATSYYERLQELLEAEKIRKGILLPQSQVEHGAFVQEFMINSNNLGVSLSRIAQKTGDAKVNSRALAYFSESTRAWDALTRNQDTMIRAQGANLGYLNMQNLTHPQSGFIPEIYSEIAKTLENEKILKQRVDE